VVLTTVALALTLGANQPDAGRYVGSTPPADIAMTDFDLRGHDGGVVSCSDLRGEVTLLTFLDSQCTESCRVIAWTVARTLDLLTDDERAGLSAFACLAPPALHTLADGDVGDEQGRDGVEPPQA